MNAYSQIDTTIKPFNAVIFGGDGDLAKRKIIPAFYHRFADEQLSAPHQIICVSRSKEDEKAFNKLLTTFIKATFDDTEEEDCIDDFLNQVSLLRIPQNNIESYEALKSVLLENAERQRVYYFSVPSPAYAEISDALKKSGLIDERSKVVLEKPLGHDLASSREIDSIISAAFREEQIFRIDHYLGKETVQNLMVLRFANHLFERAWNAENIENIQITVAESLGVEKRVGYYDKTGALLDMVQNHLLQLLCLIAMEPPANLNARAVRNEKVKVLQSLRLFDKSSVKENIVRGQYTRGNVMGENVKSYLEDIQKYDSGTETFVALKAHIDNWRWKNVPFYLRTGKRMKKRYSDIVINFKTPPHNIFPPSKHSLRNQLIIRLQPNERIELVQLSKIPGPGGYRFQPISLKLDFLDSFQKRMPDAYERLIIDILRGNHTLFMRHDELEAAWKWIESITDNWKDTPIVLYESGEWGPGNDVMDEGTSWEGK
ncbi:MAG: glucose-6-phosphate dehydrogenase [Crocinitomicaceae bacterium]|nr:glucose-6-phosphate dehydrogenase [Crocinitomicaceae bacterium]